MQRRSVIDKKAVSAVVATVLIIMITVAAVGVVWAVIIPMIQDNLGGSVVCNDADVSIGTTQGFTCYDVAQQVVAVQAVKGANKVVVSGLKFTVSFKGNSVSYSTNYSFDGSASKVFYINVSELNGVEEMGLIPVLTDGKSTKECGKVVLNNVPNCKLPEVEVINCNANCSCAANTVFGQNCSDGCGGNCTGILPISLTNCQEIDEPGSYLLQNDVSSEGTCFTITANDILLDGNGKSIESTVGSAIVFSGASENNTIQNADINAGTSDCDDGTYYCSGIVFVSTSNNDVVEGNTINAPGYGVDFEGSSLNSTIFNNIITLDYGYCINFGSSSYNGNISGNSLTSSGYGIYSSSSSGDFIYNNVISSTYYSGISLGSPTNDRIFENTIYSFDDAGLYFSFISSGNIISSNSIESNNYVGIMFYGASLNNVINGSNNIMAGVGVCNYGDYACSGIVYGSTSTNDRIDGNNIISYQGAGVGFGGFVNSSTVTNNILAGGAGDGCGLFIGNDCGSGISFVYSVNNVTIESNQITGLNRGVYFASSLAYSSLSGNTINGRSASGITFIGASSNNVINGSNVIKAGSESELYNSECFDDFSCSGIVYGSTSTNDIINGNSIEAFENGIYYVSLGPSTNPFIGSSNTIIYGNAFFNVSLAGLQY